MKIYLQVVCVFALFCAVLTLTEEEDDKLAEQCQKKTNATTDDMKILDDDSDEFPKTRIQYCLLACYYKGANAMDDNNKLIYETVKLIELEPLKKESQDTYDEWDKITKECIESTTPDKDECESVKKYVDCYLKHAKEMGVEI